MFARYYGAARDRFDAMPKLFRFLGANMLFGLAVGVALASAMVLTNAAGLNDLISGDGHPYLAVFSLLFLFALTFASVAMGVAIMTVPPPKDGSGSASSTDDDDLHS